MTDVGGRGCTPSVRHTNARFRSDTRHGRDGTVRSVLRLRYANDDVDRRLALCDARTDAPELCACATSDDRKTRSRGCRDVLKRDSSSKSASAH
jgi:hypothetical protein